MTTMQILFLGVVFAAVFGIALVVLLNLGPNPAQERLKKLSEASQANPPSGEAVWVKRIVKLSGPLSKLSLPSEGWENSQLRIRFMNAGFRASSAPALFFAAKTVLTFVLPGFLLFYTGYVGAEIRPALFVSMLFLVAGIGYYLPNGFLAHRIERRKREIFESFPDAIDIMTVCVEAGLGLDAALARVGEEIRLTSTTLADELHLVNLELRAGSSRERALRNLAMRTGVEEIDALVAMLIQAEHFGTSVADSLRIHSDSLRTKRRLRAEEAAAKIPLKLLFPLLFCVFPSMMLVLLGPAFISIYRVLLPTLGAHGG